MTVFTGIIYKPSCGILYSLNLHVGTKRGLSWKENILSQKCHAKNKNDLVLLTAKGTKTHFYWATQNNDGTEEGFQQCLLNIVDHYQVNNVHKFFYT